MISIKYFSQSRPLNVRDLSAFRISHRLHALSLSPTLLLSADTIVNAWSVSGKYIGSSDFASSLFSSSLLPYLAFLYYIGKAKSTPESTNFGFKFLLVFVLATIPAGIYAKLQYHDILANVDWLHGGAEVLLTITNLLIVRGFLQARDKAGFVDKKQLEKSDTITPTITIFIALQLLLQIIIFSGIQNFHSEPLNALSLPTWIIHVSSIAEWLVAMELAWKHSYTSNNSRWKGLTMAMLPAQASGLSACTFHIFYNSPAIYWVVALQAFLTFLGNSTLALAAYRIWDYDNNRLTNNPSPNITPSADFNTSPNYGKNIILTSLVTSIFIKLFSQVINIPSDPDPQVVLSMILLPTIFTALSYLMKSNEEEISKPTIDNIFTSTD